MVGEGKEFMINGAYEFVRASDFGVSQPAEGRFSVVHPIMQCMQYDGDNLQVGQLALHAIRNDPAPATLLGFSDCPGDNKATESTSAESF